MSKPTIEQRTEWLQEFQVAHREAVYALAAIAGQVATLNDAGLNGVAATFGGPLRLAQESVAAMDEAISRMIHEDAQASWNQIGETFAALLETTNKTGSEVDKRLRGEG